MNQSILQLQTQIEYQSLYSFTTFLVTTTNQSLVHERLRMVESDIGRLSWVSLLFKQELVPVVKSSESVGVAV